jgi:hypothetical protein
MKQLIAIIVFVLISATGALAATTSQPAFDLTAALSSNPVPGATITIPAGDYTPAAEQGVPNYPWVIRWQGTADQPITLRAAGHVVIHGGLQLLPPATHVYLQGLEVVDAVNDGISLESGDGCKVIDCIVHGCATSGVGDGIAAWQSTTNTEIEGCVVWGNGTAAVISGGHGLYTQNAAATGTKTIDNCVFYPPASADHYELHAYGAGGPVEGYNVKNDVFIDGTALIGPESLPAKAIVVTGCDFYHADLNLGLSAPFSYDATVTGCLFDGGVIDDNRFLSLTLSGNDLRTGSVAVVYPNGAPAGSQVSLNIAPTQAVGFNFYNFPDGFKPPVTLWPGQQWAQIRPGYIWTDTWFRGNSAAYPPAGLTDHLWTDPYDSSRAVLSVFNRSQAPAVSVDLSSFLHTGDHYKILDPRAQWGPPVLEGDYSEQAVSLPEGETLAGRADLGAWAAYVVERTPAAAPVTLPSLALEVQQLKDLLSRVAAKVGVS